MSHSLLVKNLIIGCFGCIILLLCIGYLNHAGHNMNTISQKIDCTQINSDLAKIKNQYASGSINGNQCHMKVHMLSRQIVAQCGFDVARQKMDKLCRGAMVHGTMEGFVIQNQNKGGVVEDAKGRCDHFASGNSRTRKECIHGIGNGLIVNSTSLRGEKQFLNPAIKKCEELQDDLLIKMCISGIYGGKFRYDTVINRDGNYCIGKPYEAMCRIYVGFYFDPAKDTEDTWCKNSDYQQSCRFGLGVMYSRVTDNNIDQIIKVCISKDCFDGAKWEAERVGKSEIIEKLQK